MTTLELIDLYLNDHKLSWAPTTLKSERARLNAIAEHLLPQNPSKLWEVLIERNIKPYARVTVWIRASHFIDWCIKERRINDTHCLYQRFKDKNQRLFRHTYQRRLVTQSYEDVRQLCERNISSPEVKEIALSILESGMRISEALSFTGETVIGKGNKPRKVYSNRLPSKKLTYDRVYSNLTRSTGLTPHMLRKAFLSRLVELGANPFELCEIAGWSNLQTASSYIKIKESKLQSLMDKVKSNE